MVHQAARRGFWLTLLFGGWLCLGLSGCDVGPGMQQTGMRQTGMRQTGGRISQPSTSTAASPQPSGDQLVNRRVDTITIASFNIQVLGQSKAAKPHVMDILAQVARRFDLVAIQEVRSKNQDIVPRLVEQINANGARYGFVIGPRLGRTVSKEQYAFVYDTTRIEVLPGSVYTVADPQDYLHRPPLVAGFRTRGALNQPPFTFSLINIHTDPDETKTELNALDDVFVAVQNDGRGEDDIILLGDLNVDDRHLGELGQLPGIVNTVAGEKTNTRRTKSYDNIVFDSRHTVEYTGSHGIVNLLSEFGLTEKQAIEVSDHLPVWAEFSIHESNSAFMANRPGAVR